MKSWPREVTCWCGYFVHEHRPWKPGFWTWSILEWKGEMKIFFLQKKDEEGFVSLRGRHILWHLFFYLFGHPFRLMLLMLFIVFFVAPCVSKLSNCHFPFHFSMCQLLTIKRHSLLHLVFHVWNNMCSRDKEWRTTRA